MATASCAQVASCPLAGREAIDVIRSLEQIKESQSNIIKLLESNPDGVIPRVRSLETSRDKTLGWNLSKVASRGLLFTVLGMLMLGGMNIWTIEKSNSTATSAIPAMQASLSDATYQVWLANQKAETLQTNLDKVTKTVNDGTRQRKVITSNVEGVQQTVDKVADNTTPQQQKKGHWPFR